MVTGLPEFSIEQSDVCRGCALRKYTKTAFSSSDTRAAGVLDLIHSDICSPMSSVSLTGFEYYISFIDDYSRKTWIYFLRSKKSELVLRVFQGFKALVEKQTGRKIRMLRSDNGGEYTSKEFDAFCRQEGIQRQLTVPYTPEQNGVAERKNRSIVGAARAMLHDQGLPFFLWAEACSTAVYLQNRSPHRAVGSKTPEEMYSGKKPEVGHFRIFGSLTYSHVPSEKRTKFDPTAERGIFVGYDETSKAYRLYLPSLRRVVVRREVKFDEERAFRKSRELEQGETPAPTPQLVQASSMQLSCPQISGVTGSQGTGTASTGSVIQVASTSGTVSGTGSGLSPQITGSSGTGSSGTGPRGVGPSGTGPSSAEESPRPVWEEQSSRKRKPKWLQKTLKDAKAIGKPQEQIRTVVEPDRYGVVPDRDGMALVASLRDYEPSTFEEASQHQVWTDAMMEEYHSIMKNDARYRDRRGSQL